MSMQSFRGAYDSLGSLLRSFVIGELSVVEFCDIVFESWPPDEEVAVAEPEAVVTPVPVERDFEDREKGSGGGSTPRIMAHPLRSVIACTSHKHMRITATEVSKACMNSWSINTCQRG